jgi:hypothetical protein
MPNTATKEELTERAQLVRVHEANCDIEHPTADELKFRLAIMKKIGVAFGLRDMLKLTFAGPEVKTPSQKPAR